MQIAWRNSIIDPATGRSEMWEPQKEPGFRLFATKHLQTRLVFVPSFCVQLFAGLVWISRIFRFRFFFRFIFLLSLKGAAAMRSLLRKYFEMESFPSYTERGVLFSSCVAGDMRKWKHICLCEGCLFSFLLSLLLSLPQNPLFFFCAMIGIWKLSRDYVSYAQCPGQSSTDLWIFGATQQKS